MMKPWEDIGNLFLIDLKKATSAVAFLFKPILIRYHIAFLVKGCYNIMNSYFFKEVL